MEDKKIHVFQSKGSLEDYGVFYDLNSDMVYFRANIINEVSQGGYLSLPNGKFLSIPQGTLLQRFEIGCIAKWDDNKKTYVPETKE